MVISNRESGDGYSDIEVRDIRGDFAMVIEVKSADDGNLDAACKNAFKQMNGKRYADVLLKENFSRILKYAIAFYLKKSKVMLEICK